MLCDVNRNVNKYNYNDMFGILNTPNKWGFEFFFAI